MYLNLKHAGSQIMSNYVKLCQIMPSYVKLCQIMSNYVKLCQIILKMWDPSWSSSAVTFNLFPYYLFPQITTIRDISDGERKGKEETDNCQLGHFQSKQNCSASGH